MNGGQKERLREIGGTLGVGSDDIGEMRRKTRILRYLRLIFAGLSPILGFVLGFIYGESTRPAPIHSTYPYLASIALVGSTTDPRLRAALVSKKGGERTVPMGGRVLVVVVISLAAVAFVVGCLIGAAQPAYYAPTPEYAVYSQ